MIQLTNIDNIYELAMNLFSTLVGKSTIPQQQIFTKYQEASKVSLRQFSGLEMQ